MRKLLLVLGMLTLGLTSCSTPESNEVVDNTRRAHTYRIEAVDGWGNLEVIVETQNPNEAPQILIGDLLQYTPQQFNGWSTDPSFGSYYYFGITNLQVIEFMAYTGDKFRIVADSFEETTPIKVRVYKDNSLYRETIVQPMGEYREEIVVVNN